LVITSDGGSFFLRGSLPGKDNNLWGDGWKSGDASYYDSGVRIALPRQDIYFIINRDAGPAIYQTDFSSDPGWITDQPFNFYWDESQEVFFARSENRPPDYAPNRSAFTPTVLDATKSFLLEWDEMPFDVDDNGRVSFGLFKENLSLNESTVSLMYHSGGFQFNVRTQTGFTGGGDHFGSNYAQEGVWYRNVLFYDATHNFLTLVIQNKETGVRNVGFSMALVPDSFPMSMKNLGVSNYPFDGSIWPDVTYTAYIDNIVLRGLPREGLAPPLPEPPLPACCSNVAFIPGLQATRLELGANRLWEPNGNPDVQKLFLDNDGNPISPGIVPNGIIDEAFGFNIYKNFISFMDTLVTDGVIEEWKPFPYDWRYGVEELADGMYDEFLALAQYSPTGKASIIAHSNGGLIAKALIKKLEEEGNADKVDKLIMVAAPQLGTPKAIASLLHGDEQTIPPKIGIVLTKRTARGLAENMPSAYTLLPSERYFEDVLEAVIEFDPDVANITELADFVGTAKAIDTAFELHDFITGHQGTWQDPAFGNTDAPNVLNKLLLARATSTQAWQDAWVPPLGIKVTQIAGWGLDTIRGIRYDDCDIPFCADTLNHLDRKLLMVHDGDGTVVIPSAVAMEVDTYYVNLQSVNGLGEFRRNRDHADIMEVEEIHGLFKNLIGGISESISDFISTTKPLVKDEDKKLRFRIHSPVSLDLYDAEGNHTGLIQNPDPDSDLQRLEQQIPNSYYLEFGETKYAGADTFATSTVVLTGLDTGTFTFEIDEVLGDEVVASSTFTNIPVLKGAIVTMDIQHIGSSTVLAIDMNGDGEVDAVVAPGSAISIQDLFSILRNLVSALELPRGQDKKIAGTIDRLERKLEKEYGNRTGKRAVVDNAFAEVRRAFEQLEHKGLITAEELRELMHIVEQIKVGVVG